MPLLLILFDWMEPEALYEKKKLYIQDIRNGLSFGHLDQDQSILLSFVFNMNKKFYLGRCLPNH